MANYATADQVASEFKGLLGVGGFTSSTSVTLAQVNDWITRATAFINSKIAGKYTVPVDATASPNAFALLTDVCVWLVKPRVAAVLSLASGNAKTSTTSGKGADWNQRAMDILKEIQDGTMKLTDAPLATTGDGSESFTNNNSGTLQPPTFTRAGDDW